MDILIYPTASQRFKYIYNPEQRKTQYGISHCLMPRTKTKQCRQCCYPSSKELINNNRPRVVSPISLHHIISIYTNKKSGKNE